MATSTGLMTYEEFLELPDEYFEIGKCELVDGELLQMPPAFVKHAKTSHRIFRIFDHHFPADGMPSDFGEPYLEVGYKLGQRSWLQPDVSISYLNQPSGDYFEGAPALAVEVLSRANTPSKIARKVRLFLEHGAREVWVVNPKRQCIVVHRLDGAIEYTGLFHPELIPGLSIDIPSLFA